MNKKLKIVNIHKQREEIFLIRSDYVKEESVELIIVYDVDC